MLKKLLCLILITISTSACDFLYGNHIDKIIQNSQLEKKSVISVMVRRLKDGKDLYQYNSQYLMMPASGIKLLTGYAALSYLKKDFIYSTEIKTNRKNIANGILKDNLYIKFSGDPTLTSQNLKDLISQLKKSGIQNIQGNIILDDSMFDQTYQSAGTSFDDFIFAYTAPSSAISINQNSFKAGLTIKDGESKLIHSEPIFAEINNNIKIDAEDSDCSPILTANDQNIYNLSGCMAKNAQNLELQVAYINPRKYAQQFFSNLFKELKTNFTGNIIFDTTPPSLELLAIHQSAPMKDLVKITLKDSDNLIAKNISKTIGARYYNTQGSFVNAAKAMKEILWQNAKINPDEYSFYDGSGGSRYNLFSAKQFIELLTVAYNDPEIYDDIYDSLAIAAKDGKLAKRFLDYPDINLRAKTGGLKGVISLSGYTESSKHGMLAFSIILNGAIGDMAKYYKLVDQIAVSLSED